MLVYKQFAVWQVGIILGYVAVLVGCSGFFRDFCSSGSSDACLAARVAPEECLLLSPHDFMLEMCGGYVCTLNCIRFRFIIRFIVALPVEP